MASGQKINITITGIQYPVGAGEDEAVTTIQKVEAELFARDKSLYLFYMEHPEGFPAPVRTRIKLKEGTLEIHRQGPGGSTMFFAPGQCYRTEYPTPYGVLLLDIVTKSVEVKHLLEGEWPRVTIEYVLQNDGEDMARYKLSLENKLNY